MAMALAWRQAGHSTCTCGKSCFLCTDFDRHHTSARCTRQLCNMDPNNRGWAIQSQFLNKKSRPAGIQYRSERDLASRVMWLSSTAFRIRSCKHYSMKSTCMIVEELGRRLSPHPGIKCRCKKTGRYCYYCQPPWNYLSLRPCWRFVYNNCPVETAKTIWVTRSTLCR